MLLTSPVIKDLSQVLLSQKMVRIRTVDSESTQGELALF